MAELTVGEFPEEHWTIQITIGAYEETVRRQGTFIAYTPIDRSWPHFY